MFVIAAALLLREPEPMGSGGVGYVPPKSEDGTRHVPVIEAEVTEVDFGTVPNVVENLEDIPEKEIKLYNKGVAPLTITEIKTSCPCTQGYMDTATIPPGGETPLRITLDPYGVYGFSADKTLSISSNDPVNTTIEIRVRAKIEPEFTIEPEVVDFGEIEKGEMPEAELTMRRAGEQPLRITEVVAPDGLEAEFAPIPSGEWTDPAREEYRINVRVTPDVAPGSHVMPLLIKSEFKRPPAAEHKLVVNVKVKSFYTVSPGPQVRFFNGKPGERVYTVQIKGESPVEITDLAVQHESLKATAEPGETPDRARIQIAVAEGAAAGHIETGISFKVKSGEKLATQKLDVSGWVAEDVPTASPAVPSL